MPFVHQGVLAAQTTAYVVLTDGCDGVACVLPTKQTCLSTTDGAVMAAQGIRQLVRWCAGAASPTKTGMRAGARSSCSRAAVTPLLAPPRISAAATPLPCTRCPQTNTALVIERRMRQQGSKRSLQRGEQGPTHLSAYAAEGLPRYTSTFLHVGIGMHHCGKPRLAGN